MCWHSLLTLSLLREGRTGRVEEEGREGRKDRRGGAEG